MKNVCSWLMSAVFEMMKSCHKSLVYAIKIAQKKFCLWTYCNLILKNFGLSCAHRVKKLAKAITLLGCFTEFDGVIAVTPAGRVQAWGGSWSSPPGGWSTTCTYPAELSNFRLNFSLIVFRWAEALLGKFSPLPPLRGQRTVKYHTWQPI